MQFHLNDALAIATPIANIVSFIFVAGTSAAAAAAGVVGGI